MTRPEQKILWTAVALVVSLVGWWLYRSATREAPMALDRLQIGTSISGRLTGGEIHAYELTLASEHYAEVILEQQGIDVVLALLDGSGDLAAACDHPSGPEGLERVAAIAHHGDPHFRLEVRSEGPATDRGQYRLWIEALRPATDQDRKSLEGRLAFARGEELRRKGTTESRREAVTHYQQALETWRSTAETRPQAEALHRLGGLYLALKDYDAAGEAYQQAVPLFRSLADRLWEGIVLSQLSKLELRRSQTAAARVAAEGALAAFRTVESPARQATALNALGNVLQRLGEVQSALDAYAEAQTLARQGGQVLEEANALSGQGVQLTYQGKLQLAQDVLEQALELYRREGDARGAAGVRSRIATIYYRRGELDRARSELESVLVVRRKLKDPRGVAITLSSLGTVQLSTGRKSEALASYHQALKLYREGRDRNGEAGALANLGRFFQQMGDARKALGYHLAASELFEATESHRDRVSSLYNIALAHHQFGSNEEAQGFLERAFDEVEELRATTPRIDLREAYLATKQHYFDLYVEVLMDLHREDPGAGFDLRALQIHERRRARSLLDLLQESGAEVRRQVAPDLLEQEALLQRDLLAVEQALAATGQGLAGSAEFERRQRRLLQQLATVRGRIRISSPQFAELSGPPLVDLAAIQDRLLDAASQLLVYSLGDENSYLWWIAADGSMITQVLPPRLEIESLVHETCKAWRSLSTWQRRNGEERAHELSRILLGPVAQHLGHQRLVVVADGALQTLPFAALPSPHQEAGQGRLRRLIEDHEIVYLPSASSLLVLRKRLHDRPLAPRRLAVLADPVFGTGDARFQGHRGSGSEGGELDDHVLAQRSVEALGFSGFERLIHSGEEAADILALIPAPQRFGALGFDATRELVLSGELRSYRVLHLATHALLNDLQPELSGLVFSLIDREGRRQPGFLQAHEIYGLDFNAELVVLSACRTGSGKEVRGEGLVGLTRGFFYAGAPRLVVSLWNVGDESTSILMRHFYHYIFGGSTGESQGLQPAAALRAAQLKMLQDERFSHPYHWAGFIFQGEWQGRIAASGPPLEAAETSDGSDEHDQDMPIPGADEPPVGGSDDGMA